MEIQIWLDATHLQVRNYTLRSFFPKLIFVHLSIHRHVQTTRTWLFQSRISADVAEVAFFLSSNNGNLSIFDFLSSNVVSGPNCHDVALAVLNFHIWDWLIHSFDVSALGREAKHLTSVDK